MEERTCMGTIQLEEQNLIKTTIEISMWRPALIYTVSAVAFFSKCVLRLVYKLFVINLEINLIIMIV